MKQMSYLVLARKWRPQVFEDVVGQRHITKTLQNAISQNRVSHAFLFTGSRGVGKTSTARILAKALNCERGPHINPCNQCKTCEEITHGTSLDVIEIDGASNRGIDEIRELRENVRYTPAKSRYKIYIIDEVHMLTREAFNALLKTLEEPPPHIIFIFATTEPHKVPETILSRCQRYDFKRIPLKLIIESLKRIVEEEKINISQRGIFSIAQESDGSLRDAQSILDQVISYSGKEVKDEDIAEILGLIDKQIIYDTIKAVIEGDLTKCLKIVDHVYQYGIDLQNFCRELLKYIRDLIIIKVSNRPETLLEPTEDEFEILKNHAESLDVEQLDHLFSILLKGEEEIAQSTFPRIMMEMTLIRMATIKQIIKIEDIINRLERIGRDDLRPDIKDSEASLISENIEMGNNNNKQPGLRRREIGEFKEERSLYFHENFETPSLEVQEESESHVEEESESHVEEQSESQESYQEIWKGLVEYTKTRNPILGSFLALGSLVEINDEKVELGFEKDSFHYDRILEKENKKQLESICKEYFKKDVKLIISPFEVKERMNNRSEAKAKMSNHFKLENEKEEKIENPIIKEIVDIFNGKIIQK